MNGKQWKEAPSELWVVPRPESVMGDSSMQIFATERAAMDYAKKRAQEHDRYWRVYKMDLHGTAIPQESQYSKERP